MELCWEPCKQNVTVCFMGCNTSPTVVYKAPNIWYFKFLLYLLFSGRYEESIDLTKKALKYLPSDAQLFFNLGNVHGKRSRWEESEKNFLKAIRLNPNVAKFYANLGMYITSSK